MDENSTKTKEINASDEVSPSSHRQRNEGKKYIKTTVDQQKSSFEIIGTALSWFLVIITFPISIFICFFRVNEFNRAIVFRLGRVRKGTFGPGLVWHLPCIDSYSLVDLRTRVEIIPSQDVITKDSVSISVDAVLFYCIEDSMNATIQISNVHESTIFIAQTTLRNILGSMNLHELLVSRQILSEKITTAVDHATEKWGVKIERVEIKDISLPDALQRSLASEAEALREARAKIISAEGELNASRALQEASAVMAQNEVTLQLRHLSTLTSLAQEHHLTIVYPFPMEMWLPYAEKGDGDNKKPDNKSDGSSEKATEITPEMQEDPPLRLYTSLSSIIRGKSDEFQTPPPEPEDLADEAAGVSNQKSPNPQNTVSESTDNKKGTQTNESEFV